MLPRLWGELPQSPTGAVPFLPGGQPEAEGLCWSLGLSVPSEGRSDQTGEQGGREQLRGKEGAMARWGGGVRELQGVVDAGSSLGRWGRRALPVPRRDEALPAARHEALALVFSNPQAHGCRLFIFIGVRLTFSLYFFFNQRTNISAKSLFLFKFFFPFFSFFLFSLLSCSPTRQISVQTRHCWRRCFPRAARGSVRGGPALWSGPGDPTRPRREQHPGRGVLAPIYIKVRSLCIIPHL